MADITGMLRAAASSAITPPATDPNFKQTVLLLHGDGTNGAQNNTFIDGSTNNFTINRLGNTTQGSFSPFSMPNGYWSNYFDFTDDRLTVADDAALRPGTSNFTIEAWVYRSATNQAHSIFAKGDTSTGFVFEITSTNLLRFTYTTTSIDSTGTVAANTWVHVAVVREGTGTNQTKLYINGVQDGQGTVSTDFNQTQEARIGEDRSGSNDFNGHISNLRYVIGSAVYTSGFTPSSSPFTTTSQGVSSSEVKLLTCQSNRFIDNSNNNFTISSVGSTRVTPFSPFAPNSVYSTTANGASGHFDGTGDYLTITSGVTNQFDPGSAFTFECWFYQSSGTSNLCFEVRGSLNSFDASNGILFRVWPNSSGSTFFQFNTAGAATSISTTAPPYNTWVHLAVGYNGTTTRFWVNGVSAGTSTASYTKPTYDRVTIGNSNANLNPMNGYLSSMRFVKGSDVYGVSNTTITVPTSPSTAITNTSLLLNFTNGAIFDNTGKHVLETIDNAQIDTTTKKYGTGSIDLDGTGDWILIRDSQELDFGSGDFTFECWLYWTLASTTALVSKRPTTATFPPIAIRLASGGGFNFYASAGSSFNVNITLSNGTITTNTWNHIAFTRNGSTFTAWINGVSRGTATSTITLVKNTASMSIGAFAADGTNAIRGFFDEVRITKGVARYTSTFTPPTEAFLDR
jgi:hypothetical protein